MKQPLDISMISGLNQQWGEDIWLFVNIFPSSLTRLNLIVSVADA
jgi:hypothetical protein